ncbi:MAG: hypothetical protein KKB63_09280, partial [Alphaproteobacteria bacterium]|nr:hypothetical protein [Alphaproteobacteria bacterium]
QTAGQDASATQPNVDQSPPQETPSASPSSEMPGEEPRARPDLRSPDLRSDTRGSDDERLAGSPPVVEKVIVKRGGGWFATLVALLALAVAVFTLLLPSVQPWLQAHYGHIEPVAFVLGQKSEMDRLREQLALMDRQTGELAKRLDAEEATSSSAAERMARLDAIFGSGAASGTAPVAGAGLPGVSAEATPAEQQAWRDAVSGRIDALAVDFAAVIALQQQTAEDVAALSEGLTGVEPLGGEVQALLQRLDQGDAQVAETKAAIAALTETVEPLRQADADASAKAEAIASEVAALATRLDGLETQAKAADASVMEAVGKMSALEEVIGGWKSAIENVRLSQAMFHLTDVLETHAVFSREIAYVRNISQDEALSQRIGALLEPLAVYADSGVATRAELRDSFSAIVAPKLLAVSNDARPWLDRMRSWVGGMIAAETVVASGGGDPTRQLVNTASRALSEDDLDLAIEAIGRLEGQPAMVAQRWLVEAQARRVLDTQSTGLAALGMELASK